ncbi:MAG: hypothetical protein AAFX87_00120 [Bacteroidota bacterium]
MLTFEDFRELNFKEKILDCADLFEAFLIEEGLAQSNWKIVLQTIREIENTEFWDEWLYKYCEILPDSILEEDSFDKNKADWEYIDAQTFYSLKDLYTGSVYIDRINKSMNLIHELASIEVYTDSRKVSKISYKPYVKFCKLVSHNTGKDASKGYNIFSRIFKKGIDR